MSETDSLDHHAVKICGLMGLPENPNDDPEHKRRLAIYAAQENCSQCAQCQKPIWPGDPVWRTELSLGRGILGGWRCTVAPVCAQCKSDYQRYRHPVPCEGCGRFVYNEDNFRGHSRTFCCEECECKARAADARRARAEARGSTRACAECSEMFEPRRADSKFCSAACKQKAHRHRVTDRVPCASGSRNVKTAAGAPVGSRNVTDRRSRRRALRIIDGGHGPPNESRNDDDLSIPAFLRRSEVAS
jgi:hypothetical protein